MEIKVIIFIAATVFTIILILGLFLLLPPLLKRNKAAIAIQTAGGKPAKNSAIGKRNKLV